MGTKSFITHALSHLFRTRNASSHKGDKTTRRKPGSQGSDAEQESSADHQRLAVMTPQEILEALNVQIYDDGGDGYYLVGFQGGVFIFNFTETSLTVLYNDVEECTYADSIKAVMIANDINGDYSAWSCYLRTLKNGKSEKPIKVCFSQLFPLSGDSRATIGFIRSVLLNAFTVAREFRSRFQEAIANDSSLGTLLNQRDFTNKLELAKRLMEVGNWDEVGEEQPDAKSLKLAALAELFADTEFGTPLSLQVIADKEVQNYTEVKDIEEFDIRNFVRNHPRGKELESISLIVCFEKQDLIVHLKKMAGSTPKSLFFLMNVMRSGVDTDQFRNNHTSVSCRTTVEIRLTTEQEDYWEVKYMVEDAKDKYTQHRESELSDEQKMLLINLRPTIQDDLYWGMKFYTQKCWFQSLFYLQRLYYNLVRLSRINPDESKVLTDVCIYIGMIYSQLKLHDRAYYYFDKGREQDSIFSAECYINCLCNLKDNTVIEFINNSLKVVNEHRNDDSFMDKYYDFYLFLKRKLVHAFVFEMRLKEAEDLLLQMIDDDENVEYAQHKLEYVRRKRKEMFQQLRNKHKKNTLHKSKMNDAGSNDVGKVADERVQDAPLSEEAGTKKVENPKTDAIRSDDKDKPVETSESEAPSSSERRSSDVIGSADSSHSSQSGNTMNKNADDSSESQHS